MLLGHMEPHGKKVVQKSELRAPTALKAGATKPPAQTP